MIYYIPTVEIPFTTTITFPKQAKDSPKTSKVLEMVPTC
jgi:hypothetical protein